MPTLVKYTPLEYYFLINKANQMRLNEVEQRAMFMEVSTHAEHRRAEYVDEQRGGTSSEDVVLVPRSLSRPEKRKRTNPFPEVYEEIKYGAFKRQRRVEEDTTGNNTEDHLHPGPVHQQESTRPDQSTRNANERQCRYDQRSNERFNRNFKALLEYKHKFGHCNVTRRTHCEFNTLAIWVQNQRTAYKNPSPHRNLTDEKIRRMEEIGFKWSMRQSLDERFEELMQFKQKYGHCEVPQRSCGDFVSLGKWCSKVRCAYRKIQKGETPDIKKLSAETIRRFEDAGFKWDLA